LQPIPGNAGNPEALDATGDNWNFYELLLLSNNYLFNTNFPISRINQKNFAINGRCYDTTRTDTLLDSNVFYRTNTTSLANIVATTAKAGKTTINAHTAMGQSHFH
jgi:D-alanyl-D-alanine carboxypeptidase